MILLTCFTAGNTGQQYCTPESILGDPIGMILALDGSNNEFTAANFLLETTYETGINARRLFPIMFLKGFTDNSEETVYFDYPSGDRKLVRQGKYRFQFDYNVNECVKKELFDFQGYSQKIFLLYNDNIIRGRTTDSGVTIKGMRVKQINVIKEKQGNFGEPAMMLLEVDFADYKDLNQYDYAMEMAWEVSELDGLTEVTLAESGTPTIISLVVSVNAVCNGESKPITGLVFADFNITGAGTLGVEGGFADNGDGTYTFVTVGLINGDIVNLDAPSVIADPDLFIISGGALTIAGIA